MMFKKLACLIPALTLFSITACDPRTVAELDARLSVKLDPSLNPSEVKRLRSDLASMIALNLAPRSGTPFTAVFKGSDTASVLSYLDERVNYVISNNVSIQQRLVEKARFAEITNASQPESTPSKKKKAKAVTAATNIGTAIWLLAVGSHQSAGFRIGTAVVPVESSRIGLIQLGPGYRSATTSFEERISTLVHEARHSDCTGGLSVQDAEAFVNSRGADVPNRNCGHTHSICPATHKLAGYYACDDHPWGSYTIEGIYDAAVAFQCSNCDEATKQVAKAALFDSFSRVQVDIQAMLKGELGLPDMSSATVVPQDLVRDRLNGFRIHRISDPEAPLNLTEI